MKEVIIAIRAAKTLKDALACEAEKDRRTLSSLVLKILDEWISRRKQ